MIAAITFSLIISISIISVKFFFAQNTYEKITSFYFIFTNIILLIMVSSIANFESILDIIIVLFLIKLMAVLFLIFNRKKI